MLDEDSVKEGKVCEPKVWDGFDWDWVKFTNNQINCLVFNFSGILPD